MKKNLFDETAKSNAVGEQRATYLIVLTGFPKFLICRVQRLVIVVEQIDIFVDGCDREDGGSVIEKVDECCVSCGGHMSGIQDR